MIRRFLNIEIGATLGCALSPALFGLFIDDLEQMVAKVIIGNVVIMLMLCVDVVPFSNTLRDAQKLMKALETIANILV